MYLCPCVKIDHSFLVSFTEHDTFSLVKINIISVKQHHFADTHTRWSQHINHCQISRLGAVVPHKLQRFIGVCVFNVCAGFDLVYSPNRTFQYIVLILKPRKKAWKNAADIINRNLAWFLLFLILGQVSPYVVGVNVLNTFADGRNHHFDSCFVVFKRFLGTALDSLCW